LAYLHAYLESQGNEVKMLFLNTYSYEICFADSMNAVRDFSPDVVGLQVFTQNRVSTYRIVEMIHAQYPALPIVLGGIHATVMHEQILKKYPFVIIVRGEGEITFQKLVETLRAGKDIASVEGIAFNRKGEVVLTPDRQLIDNLDSLPFPKHELFFNHGRTFGCILTSRGCPFNCSFCALESITRRRYRARSVENVMQEIEYMMKAFPQMKRVWIHDDTFFLDNERAIRFCDEVIRRKLPLEFVASGRIKPVSAELFRKLEQANFKKILFGLESGTDEILAAARKAITQKDVIETFRLLSKSKMEITTFLIVGLKGETLGTVKSTADFVKKIQKLKYTYFDDIGVLIIYPGTEICRLAKEGGQITDDFWLSEKMTPFFEAEHSKEELFRFKKILLDRIALKRLFTIDGFLAQWDMIPYVVLYLWSQRGRLVKKVLRIG